MRSEAWELLRNAAIETFGPHCMQCCIDCRKQLGLLHVDHIVPKSETPEQRLDPHNVQILCADCNRIKGTTTKNLLRNHYSETELAHKHLLLRLRFVELLSDTIERQKSMLLLLRNAKNLETRRNG